MKENNHLVRTSFSLRHHFSWPFGWGDLLILQGRLKKMQEENVGKLQGKLHKCFRIHRRAGNSHREQAYPWNNLWEGPTVWQDA